MFGQDTFNWIFWISFFCHFCRPVVLRLLDNNYTLNSRGQTTTSYLETEVSFLYQCSMPSFTISDTDYITTDGSVQEIRDTLAKLHQIDCWWCWRKRTYNGRGCWKLIYCVVNLNWFWNKVAEGWGDVIENKTASLVCTFQKG